VTPSLTWSARDNTYPSAPTLGLNHVHFFKDGRSIAVGDEGTFWRRDPSAKSWQAQRGLSKHHLHGLAFDPTGQHGVAVGDRGTVLRTRDGGQRWTQEEMLYEGHLFSVAHVADEAGGRFVMSGQRGLSFTAPTALSGRPTFRQLPVEEDVRDLAVLDDQRVIAVGGNFEPVSSVCDPGYVIRHGERPGDYWVYLLIVGVVGGFGLFSLVNLIRNLVRIAQDP